jgi:hypothetical protein
MLSEVLEGALAPQQALPDARRAAGPVGEYLLAPALPLAEWLEGARRGRRRDRGCRDGSGGGSTGAGGVVFGGCPHRLARRRPHQRHLAGDGGDERWVLQRLSERSFPTRLP